MSPEPSTDAPPLDLDALRPTIRHGMDSVQARVRGVAEIADALLAEVERLRDLVEEASREKFRAAVEARVEVERLTSEIAAARQICDLVAITGATDDSERGQALTQAWMDYSHSYQFRRVPDETIRELAERRRDIRDRTLRRLAGGSR